MPVAAARLLAPRRAVITAPTPSRDILIPVRSRGASASSGTPSPGRTERTAWSRGVAAAPTLAGGGPAAGAVAAAMLAPRRGGKVMRGERARPPPREVRVGVRRARARLLETRRHASNSALPPATRPDAGGEPPTEPPSVPESSRLKRRGEARTSRSFRPRFGGSSSQPTATLRFFTALGKCFRARGTSYL